MRTQAGLVAEWSSSDRIGWLDASSGVFSARNTKKGEGQPLVSEGSGSSGGSFFGLLDQPGPLYVGTLSMSAVISHELFRPSANPITVHQRESEVRLQGYRKN
ncbi:hypothetical protein DUNSADRAFT_5303 [Dunaliella salina]|uniref:Encoded protein n=1 Tax=Dunaliella salina TaxID=3046 RepID=A0ABQ7GQH9_DUNSA|nr:hypothetical protein DUNSADRAFT_5303 [Dunaliella salina]|eukprot:KAF5836864.1 hypothetical protein DUNSADRAFT_5303 [Dunaliella salina]